VAHLISVAPAGDGWAIQSDDLAENLIFQTGGRAERAARALARHKAEKGRDAEIRIYLRDGALAGVVAFPSQTVAHADS
jgi:hypothetical protein